MDLLLNDIDIERRESSSSRSTSAIISTPIDTTPTRHLPQQPDFELPLLASPFKGRTSRSKGRMTHTRHHRDDRDIMPEYEDDHSRDRARRSFDITSSWVADVRQHRGQLDADHQGDDDDSRGDIGFLKPPEAGSSRVSRRSSANSYNPRLDSDRDDLPRPTSRSSRKLSDREVDRIARKLSKAASATTSTTHHSAESDEELISMSTADLGRRLMAVERETREARRKREASDNSSLYFEKIRTNGPSLQPPNSQSGPRAAKSTGNLVSLPTSTAKPPPLPKSEIVSIDDIVKRHKEAVVKPQVAAKEKARRELGLPVLPKPAPPASPSPNTSTPRQERRKGGPPVVPIRTSSSPQVQVGVVPPRTSSRTDLDSPSLHRVVSETPTVTTITTTTSGNESVMRIAMMNQAALERLESGSTTPSSPTDRRVSFQTDRNTPGGRPRNERASTTPFRSPGRKGTPSIKEDDEDHMHAVAVYLRSPNLNRYITFPKPYPEQAFQVSVAEVGSLTGAPVLLFLGLGCVRYLVALFDELAKALDLRLICVDRWGYGKTHMADEDKRGLREWAAVLERVLDEMKIDHFSVLAHSAGCPYALAAANRMKERVRGRPHLLAPWVGTDADNTYKWLKWVPNGVIKSATAAEWRLQSYFLGKPPPLIMKPVGYTFTPPASTAHLPLLPSMSASRLSVGGGGSPGLGRKPSLLHRASSIVLRSKSAEPGAGPSGSGSRAGGTTSARSSSGHLAIPSLGSSISLHKQPTPSPLDFGLSEGFDNFTSDMKGPKLPPSQSSQSKQKSRLSTYSYSYSYSRSPPPKSSSTNHRSSTTRAGSPAPPSGPSFGIALQQASHAECEPGTTSDLLSIVLNRENSNRPWQYALNYADFCLPVKIYWGAEDDKISEKSVRWLEKTIKAGAELKVLPGEGHNLMTSTETMLDVFQSLAGEIQAAQKEADLRSSYDFGRY